MKVDLVSDRLVVSRVELLLGGWRLLWTTHCYRRRLIRSLVLVGRCITVLMLLAFDLLSDFFNELDCFFVFRSESFRKIPSVLHSFKLAIDGCELLPVLLREIADVR